MYRTILLLALASFTAMAQQAADVSEAEAAQAQEGTGEPQAEQEIVDAAPDIFDPTEEVSEDYPVDFPVDI